VATQQAEQQGVTSEQATPNVQDPATQAKEQAQQSAEDVKEKVSVQVRRQLNRRSDELGQQTAGYARALHATADQLQRQGNDAEAKAAHRAGEQVQRLAGYLTESDADRFLGDAEAFARRQPWAAGAIAFAAGFVAARFLKASADGGFQGSRPLRAEPRRESLPAADTASVYGAP
jgi:hypothetical protein